MHANLCRSKSSDIEWNISGLRGTLPVRELRMERFLFWTFVSVSGGSLLIRAGLAAAAVVLVHAPVGAGIGEWVQVSQTPVNPLDLPGVTALEGKIYVIGGHDGSSFTGRVDIYDPETDQWTQGSPMPTARRGLACIALDGKIYAIGGGTAFSRFSAVEIYDPLSDSWGAGSSLATARQEPGVAVWDNKIYIIGGDLISVSTTSVEVYDPTTDLWTDGPTMLGPNNLRSSATAADGKIYTFGGFRFGGKTDIIGVLDIGAGTWDETRRLPQAQERHGVAALDDRIFIVGGVTNAGPISTFCFYEHLADILIDLPSLPVAAFNVDLLAVGIDVYCVDNIGGGVYRFTPESSTGSCSSISIFEGFKNYAPLMPVDGIGPWISTSSPHPWLVRAADHHSLSGQFMLGHSDSESFSDSVATILVETHAPVDSAAISFTYLLEPNADARISISGDGVVWVDVTPAFSLVKSTSNLIEHLAEASFDSELQAADILTAFYLRFEAKNSSTAFWWFAVDNLAIDLSSASSCCLDWSTYLGGGSVDIGHGVAIGATGDVYATGETSGSGFPSTFGPSYGGGSRDAFLSAFDTLGNLLFSRFYGTGSNDVSSDIAIDGGANVLIAEVTGSSAFAAKFDAAGNELWTTLQNGSNQDSATGIDVAGNDDVYVVGSTSSTDFPITPTEFDTGEPTAFAYNGGDEDLFLSKLDPAGSVLWSRFLGGSGQDGTAAGGITIDSAGDFYVGGVTFSTDFPAIGGHDPSYNGGRDSFVVKLDATGHIVWGTFLGGSASEAGSDLATDANGNVYAGGRTSSSGDFPILDAYDSSYSGGASDAYVSKFDENGSLVWSTYLGGSGEDSLQGITAQDGSVIIATGYTRSPNFPVVGGTPKGPGSHRAVFVSHFDVDGNLLFSTVLDGSSEEEGIGISADGSGSVVLTGFSTSPDFPLVNPYDGTQNGQHDVIVAKFQCEIPNGAPVCVVDAPDVEECAGAVTAVPLDGSGSTDPDGDELTFAWSVDCPEATFDDPASPSPTLLVESSDQCAIECEVKLVVTDDKGAASECSHSLSVVDTTPPSLIVPAPVTIECTAPGGVPVSDPRIQAWLAAVSATDSCNAVTISHNAPAFFESACGPGSETEVTFSAVDGCGNPVSVSSSITVIDTRGPDLTVPEPLVIECNSAGGVSLDDPAIQEWLASATAFDTCGTATLSHDAPAFFPAGCGTGTPITVTFSATDECGNPASASSTVTVVDMTPPNLSVPEPLVLECNGPGGVRLDDSEVQAWLGSASATDLCGNVTVSHDAPEILLAGCALGGETPIIFTATDDCGNTVSLESSVTVVDTTPPVIACNAQEIFPVNVPRGGGDDDKDKDSDDDDDKDGDRRKEPVVIIATASDLCGSAIDIEIVDVQCQKPGGGGDDKDKDGKDNDKDKDDDGGGGRSPCRVEVDGDTLTIYKSGLVGTVISWSVIATDACDNVSAEECSITVVRPPRNRDDDKDSDKDDEDDKDKDGD